MSNFEFDFQPDETETEKQKVTLGYIMLPCFKVDVIGEGCELVCNKFLCWVFETFFSHFWTGRVRVTGERWEEVNKRE